MNKQRRARIQAIISQLEDLSSEIEGIKDEEQEYAENLPDNFAEKKEKAENAVQLGEDAISELEAAVSNLGTVVDNLGEMAE
jgi:uncharacterized protein YoxC